MTKPKKLPDQEKAKEVVVQESLAIEEKDINVAPKEIPHISVGVETEKRSSVAEWVPKTALGKRVKAGDVTDINSLLDKGLPLQEAQIVDTLLPGLQSDLLSVGQSKGKFGGGKRTIWRQTQKKTAEGNKPSFATLCVVGNKNGYVGLALGKAKETVPAREKALRNAKLAVIKVVRGCGSWACDCRIPHSIPFKVKGRCGSVRITLMPAPRGKGLIVEKELMKIFQLAGIKDIYSKTFGQTRTKLNLIYACFNAIHKLSEIKTHPHDIEKRGIVEGSIVS